MKFIVVQISARKFVVAQGMRRSDVYRTVCECRTEYAAQQVAKALTGGEVLLEDVS